MCNSVHDKMKTLDVRCRKIVSNTVGPLHNSSLGVYDKKHIKEYCTRRGGIF